jgi:hypothetical protein
MINISAKIDVDNVLKILSDQQQRKVISNTTNQLALKGRTLMRNDIFSRYAIDKKKTLVIKLRKSKPGTLEATYFSRNVNLRLTHFKTKAVISPGRKGGGGLMVQMLRGQTSFFSDAFVVEPFEGDYYRGFGIGIKGFHLFQTRHLRSPHPLVFMREDSDRYPIVRPEKESRFADQSMLNMGKEISSSRLHNMVVDMINRDGTKNFDAQIRYVLVGKEPIAIPDMEE